MYQFLIGSLWLFAIWLFIFSLRTTPRKEMFWISFWTAFLGLTEPLFVPEYWNPPTLFNLAQRTGFDIESIIFAFSVGGIISVLYEVVFKTKHKPVPLKERLKSIHKLHYFFLSLAPTVFLLFWLFSKINPIYSTSIALFIGSLGAIVCRRDLTKKILVGGLMFSALYFLFFIFFNFVFPGYIDKVWNFSAISGILILGIPVEELVFALTLGMFWSSLYEHIGWYKIK
jgi:hypothetical protein